MIFPVQYQTSDALLNQVWSVGAIRFHTCNRLLYIRLHFVEILVYILILILHFNTVFVLHSYFVILLSEKTKVYVNTRGFFPLLVY